jgi:ethanolamine utilization protein EutA
VLAIDGVQLNQFDYVDVGSVIEQSNVVPIIIKSLLFK